MNVSRTSIAILILMAGGVTFAADEDKYLSTVRTFADNVLKYGKDRTYDNAAIYSQKLP